MYIFRYIKRILKIFWKRKYHCMHSSLPLVETLYAIVNTQERQSQTILITNLTPQTWKKTVPLSLHWALLSGHPKVIRKRGLPPSTCLPVPQNPKAVALVIPTDMEGKLQGIWRAENSSYFCAVGKTDTTFREFILQEKVPARGFWWDSEKQSHLQLQKFFTQSLYHPKPKFWKFIFKSSCCFIMRDYLLQQSY